MAMDIKLIFTLIFLMNSLQYCRCRDEHLSRFKNIEYNYLFNEIGISQEQFEGHYIYIKDLDINDKAMIIGLQEFALCYARLHPTLKVIHISYKNVYPADEFKANYIKANIHLNRQKDTVTISDIRFFDKRKGVRVSYPKLNKQPECN